MSLREAIRRWWTPAAWADEHPADARVQAGEEPGTPRRGRHRWTDAANPGGPAARGPVDLERDLRKRP